MKAIISSYLLLQYIGGGIASKSILLEEVKQHNLLRRGSVSFFHHPL